MISLGSDIDVSCYAIKVIHKEFPSSFTGTDLKDHLEKIGKKKVVVTGKHFLVHKLQPGYEAYKLFMLHGTRLCIEYNPWGR